MSIWHTPAVIDPDFDDFGGDPLGGLTMMQIRDPVGVEFGRSIDLHERTQDKQRWMIRLQRDDLQRLGDRLQRAGNDLIPRRRVVLRYKDEWLQYRMKWKIWNRRKKLRVLGLRMNRYAHAKEKLARQRLHDMDTYPVFWFDGNTRCNRCIPYNGHHTKNYWLTGQKDPW